MQRSIIASLVSTAALFAQAPAGTTGPTVQTFTSTAIAAPVPDTFSYVSAEAGFETALVKGVPFTGDFVTENIHTLADGNRIKNSNTTSYARDGEGRTRREITIDGLGPFSAGESHKTIFIHDPIAKIDYVLDPQMKTARKINLGPAMSKVTPDKEGNMVFVNRQPATPPAAGAREPVFIERDAQVTKDFVFERAMPTATIVSDRMPLPAGIVMQGQAGAVVAQRIRIAGGAPNTNFRNESLGKRIIEGVEADGTRSTITIPAGQIGNERPLETVSERWFSDELKTVVLTSRKDPRTGESTYRLTNLRRGEPAAQLFEIPSDYKVIEEPGPAMFRMRLDKKP